MAKSEQTHAVVDRGGYIYRGVSIPKNRVVKMDRAMFDETQKTKPSYFREATTDEVKNAEQILDLSTVESKTAQNVADAEAASQADGPVKKSGSSTPT